MCDALRELFADQFEEHENYGKEKLLISQVCKKLIKNKSIEQIADELEEEMDAIEKIVEKVAPFAPDYNEDEIIKALFGNKKIYFSIRKQYKRKGKGSYEILYERLSASTAGTQKLAESEWRMGVFI